MIYESVDQKIKWVHAEDFGRKALAYEAEAIAQGDKSHMVSQSKAEKEVEEETYLVIDLSSSSSLLLPPPSSSTFLLLMVVIKTNRLIFQRSATDYPTLPFTAKVQRKMPSSSFERASPTLRRTDRSSPI